jgi:hypothetical protein
MKRKLLTDISVLCALFMSLVGCEYPKFSWPELTGQVMDKETEQPVADAYVIAHWEGYAGGTAGDGNMICFRVAVTKTGQDGKYHFPAWKNTGKWSSTSMQHITVYAYKSGYLLDKRAEGETSYLHRFSGKEREKIDLIKTVARQTVCSHSGESRRELYDLREELYRKADAIPAAHEEKPDEKHGRIPVLEWLQHLLDQSGK